MTAPSRPAGPVRLGRAFLSESSLVVAQGLLNKLLVAADGRAGRIIEVEAYRGQQDPASHAFRGRTPRNKAMFEAGGHLYVYFSYGMHWCANVVCGHEGEAQAVLLRALAPERGVETMRAARWTTQAHRSDRDLCRGPGRLCQAMGIDKSLDGIDMTTGSSPLWIEDDGTPPPAEIVGTPRIGISVATELPWRFTVQGHPGLSRSVIRKRA
ncbi:MAG TPA: DNA-3-methyladenine glycosylase [Acidimicrobiales bacterium]